MSTQPLLLYDPLLFLLLYLKRIMLYKTLSYHFHTQFFFYFILWFMYICVHYYVFIYYYYYNSLGILYILFSIKNYTIVILC